MAVPFMLQAVSALPFLVVLISNANGQVSQEPRTLSGTVYYAGGNQPVANISVELHSTEGSLIAPITTALNGWFEFRGLRPVPYTIAIDAAEFEPVSFNVDLTLSSSRGMEIYLKPRSKSQQPTGPPVSAHELSMPQKARDLMESGRKKLYKDHDAQSALPDFQEAVTIAPDYYEAYYQVAMAFLTLGGRENAEKYFRKSVELSGDKYGDADIALGKMMLDRNDFPEGEKMVRRGIELNPTSWVGHYELGRALLGENRIDDAEKSAEQARSLGPTAPIVYRLLANVHLREKNYPALLQDLDAYLKLDPNSPAGVRAKQLRDEVQRKIAEEKVSPSPGSKP